MKAGSISSGRRLAVQAALVACLLAEGLAPLRDAVARPVPAPMTSEEKAAHIRQEWASIWQQRATVAADAGENQMVFEWRRLARQEGALIRRAQRAKLDVAALRPPASPSPGARAAELARAATAAAPPEAAQHLIRALLYPEPDPLARQTVDVALRIVEAGVPEPGRGLDYFVQAVWPCITDAPEREVLDELIQRLQDDAEVRHRKEALRGLAVADAIAEPRLIGEPGWRRLLLKSSPADILWLDRSLDWLLKTYPGLAGLATDAETPPEIQDALAAAWARNRTVSQAVLSATDVRAAPRRGALFEGYRKGGLPFDYDKWLVVDEAGLTPAELAAWSAALTRHAAHRSSKAAWAEDRLLAMAASDNAAVRAAGEQGLAARYTVFDEWRSQLELRRVTPLAQGGEERYETRGPHERTLIYLKEALLEYAEAHAGELPTSLDDLPAAPAVPEGLRLLYVPLSPLQMRPPEKLIAVTYVAGAAPEQQEVWVLRSNGAISWSSTLGLLTWISTTEKALKVAGQEPLPLEGTELGEWVEAAREFRRSLEPKPGSPPPF